MAVIMFTILCSHHHTLFLKLFIITKTLCIQSRNNPTVLPTANPWLPPIYFLHNFAYSYKWNCTISVLSCLVSVSVIFSRLIDVIVFIST